jgi:hypothetical protein
LDIPMNDESSTTLPEDRAVDTDAAPPTSQRPGDIPEKFWDSTAGTVRVDTLLKSYAELERRLSRSLPLPAGDDDAAARERLLETLGRPATPDAYTIRQPHELVPSDPALNAELHAAGYTQQQAQLLYDLAAEHLVPAIDRLVEESRAHEQVEVLTRHFGGDDAWRQVSAQLKTWGQAQLEPSVFEALSASADGVLAMHEMMKVREPDLVGEMRDGSNVDERMLDEMVRDPRYWRDRDPDFIARVTDGFKRLFSA